MGFVYKEAAERRGIKRTHYIEFKTVKVDCYKKIVNKMVKLYQIPVEGTGETDKRVLGRIEVLEETVCKTAWN